MSNFSTSFELLQYLEQVFSVKEDDFNNVESIEINDLKNKISIYCHALEKPFEPDKNMLTMRLNFLILLEKNAIKNHKQSNSENGENSVQISTKTSTSHFIYDTNSTIIEDLKEIKNYFYLLQQNFYKYPIYWRRYIFFLKKYYPDKMKKFKNDSFEFLTLKEFDEKEFILNLIANNGVISDCKKDGIISKKNDDINNCIEKNDCSTSISKKKKLDCYATPVSLKSTPEKIIQIPFDDCTDTINNVKSKVQFNQVDKRNAIKFETENTTELFPSLRINNICYKILSSLGKGGSSQVFLIQEQSNKMKSAFACKVINNISDLKILNAYINEIRLMEKMKGIDEMIQLIEYQIINNQTSQSVNQINNIHKLLSESEYKYLSCSSKPHQLGVNKISDYFFINKSITIYLIMEHGFSDLYHFLKQHKNEKLLPFQLYKKILKVMKKLYDLRIVHADIKPANFVLCSSQQKNVLFDDFLNYEVKLIDFGISKETPAHTTSIIQNETIGTMNYMSPEKVDCNDRSDRIDDQQDNYPHIQNIKYNRSSDLWSFACIIHELLFKENIFQKMKKNRFDLKIEWLRGNEEIKFCKCVKDLREIYKNPCHSHKLIQRIEISNISSLKTSELCETQYFQPVYINTTPYKIDHMPPFCSDKCSIIPEIPDSLFLLCVLKSCFYKNPEKRIAIVELEKFTNEYEKSRILIANKENLDNFGIKLFRDK